MKPLEQIFDLFKENLDAHIKTKTKDPLFHEKSVQFYEILFDCYHTIAERRQDIEEDKSMDCKEARQLTYDNIEIVKGIIEDMIDEKNSIGFDNLLRGLYDKLEDACGNARAFLEEEDEDED